MQHDYTILLSQVRSSSFKVQLVNTLRDAAVREIEISSVLAAVTLFEIQTRVSTWQNK